MPAPEPSQREDARYQCHHDVASEAVGGELLLVQLAQGTTYRLNAMGRAVWEGAIKGLTPREITGRLQAVYGMCHAQLPGDIDVLLDELLRGGLLEACKSAELP